MDSNCITGGIFTPVNHTDYGQSGSQQEDCSLIFQEENYGEESSDHHGQ